MTGGDPFSGRTTARCGNSSVTDLSRHKGAVLLDSESSRVMSCAHGTEHTAGAKAQDLVGPYCSRSMAVTHLSHKEEARSASQRKTKKQNILPFICLLVRARLRVASPPVYVHSPSQVYKSH